jgi:hypothetical protein
MLPQNLPHLCDIHKSYWVRDDLVAQYDDPTTFLTAEPCWVQPASQSEVYQYGRRDQVVTHTVYFNRNVGIRPGYIIYPTDGSITCPFDGATLEVRAYNETTAGLGVLWKAMVEEMQPR